MGSLPSRARKMLQKSGQLRGLHLEEVRIPWGRCTACYIRGEGQQQIKSRALGQKVKVSTQDPHLQLRHTDALVLSLCTSVSSPVTRGWEHADFVELMFLNI